MSANAGAPAISAAALLLVALAACGGGSLTVSEYATAAEALVAEMTTGFARVDSEWESQAPSIERARDYWEGRLEVRNQFLDGVRDLDPPGSVADQHIAAIDVFTRMTAADAALAARVEDYETITDHWQWIDTPEGRAADELLEEVYAFCRASQAEFDATQELSAFEDVPWVPSEATQVVSVAFGCPPVEGG